MTDSVHDGFYGRITGTGKLEPQAVKGAVLNARILWTFSSAYRLLGKAEYLETATRAKRVIIDQFYDKEQGGIYWSLDYAGRPADTKKQIYALGFAIYGLSEYHRATGDEEALTYAIRLFKSIEQYSFDSVKNGYCEALTRDWNEISDMRLSDKDENECKTMNTHLHILEPYTNLYRVWKDAVLEKQLRNLIELFTSASCPVLQPHFKSSSIAHARNWRRVEGDELPLRKLHSHTVQPSGQIKGTFTGSLALIPRDERKEYGCHIGFHGSADGEAAEVHLAAEYRRVQVCGDGSFGPERRRAGGSGDRAELPV